MALPTLRASMRADLLANQLDTGALAETVVYRPAVGAARTISAVVSRKPLETIEGIQQGLAPVTLVHVLNDATDGISSAEIDVGSDSIDVALRYGVTRTTRTIGQVVFNDGVSLTLEVR